MNTAFIKLMFPLRILIAEYIISTISATESGSKWLNNYILQKIGPSSFFSSWDFEAEPSPKHLRQDSVIPQHGDVWRAVFKAAHWIEKHFTQKVSEVPAAHTLKSDTLKHLYLKGAQSDICWLCGSGELSRVWYERRWRKRESRGAFKGHHSSSTEESVCQSSAAVPTPNTSI